MESSDRIAGFFILLSLIITNVIFTKAQQYRLPTTIQPSFYIVRLKIPSLHSETYTGSETISFNTSKSTNQIQIHSSPDYINITGIVLDADKTNRCTWDYENPITEILTISCLNQTVEPDQVHSITIDFESTFSSQDEYGFYKKRYEGVDYEEIVLLTRFSPTFARRVFPCFDEPEFKAIFIFFVTHPSTHQILGNTPVVIKANAADGLSSQFDQTPVMSTYSIGFLISKFEPVLENITDVDFVFNIYTKPELKGFGETAVGYGTDIMKAMGEWTGTKYHEMGLLELNSVVMEDLENKAVSSWGLLTAGEETILDEGADTTAEQKQKIFLQLGNQIAHQWFGSYISLKWWSENWLQEGFAKFFEYFNLDQLHAEFDLENQFTTNVLQEALYEDSVLSLQALSSQDEDVSTSLDILRKFKNPMTNKGASVIRMMELASGKSNFRENMLKIIKEFQFATTNPTNILQLLNFENEMEPYLYSAGYPLVTVTLNQDHESATITQEPFYLLKDEKNQNTFWNIPITYTTSAEKNFTVGEIDWIIYNKRTDLVVPVKSDSWIIVNIQQMGFFRVNYVNELWTRIIQALKGTDRNNINVLNRAQLIDDIFAVARVGKIGYDMAFELISYINHETDYYPWMAALKIMKTLISQLSDPEALELLKSHILSNINAAFPNIQEVNSNGHIEILKQSLILKWKCFLNDSTSLNNMKNKFEEFKISRMFKNFNERNLILCNGLKTSSEPMNDYNLLMKIYQDSKSRIEKEVLLSAIGCMADIELLKSYLTEIILDATVIAKYDAIKVLDAVAANGPGGVDLAVQFLIDNILKLINKYKGQFPLSDFIVTLSDKISTWSQLEKLKTLVDANTDIQDDSSIRSLKVIESNLQWADNYTSTIKYTLQHQKSAGNTNQTDKCFLILLCTCATFMRSLIKL